MAQVAEMNGKTASFHVRTVRFGNGERCPAIADASGMLVGTANAYALVVLRPPGGSAGSIEGRLRSIGMALDWGAQRGVDLDERASQLTLLNSFEIEDLKDSLRKRSRPSKGTDSFEVGAQTYLQRCAAFRDYFSWLVRVASQKLTVDDFRLKEARIKLEDFEKAIMAGVLTARSKGRKGLDDDSQLIFLETIKPG